MSAPATHAHCLVIHPQVCRGCQRPFYIRQECCLPVGAYCNLCVYLSHPAAAARSGELTKENHA